MWRVLASLKTFLSKGFLLRWILSLSWRQVEHIANLWKALVWQRKSCWCSEPVILTEWPQHIQVWRKGCSAPLREVNVHSKFGRKLMLRPFANHLFRRSLLPHCDVNHMEQNICYIRKDGFHGQTVRWSKSVVTKTTWHTDCTHLCADQREDALLTCQAGLHRTCLPKYEATAQQCLAL